MDDASTIGFLNLSGQASAFPPRPHYASCARHGSPLCVAFQADHRPGSSEHEGFFRAKMVFPEALIFETAQVPKAGVLLF